MKKRFNSRKSAENSPRSSVSSSDGSTSSAVNGEGRLVSLIAETDAEWVSRPIGVFGAVAGFASQLSVGADLTRISMPAIFFHPYSQLELLSYRTLRYLSLLKQAASLDHPQQRMVSVVSWYLSIAGADNFNKKGFNPVLGETHVAGVRDKSVEYVSEQVSHHPPVTAYRMSCNDVDISLLGNAGFKVSFGGNSAGSVSAGFVRITVGDEVYVVDKPIPDFHLHNVIMPGPKRFQWTGRANIVCEATGLRTSLRFFEKTEGGGWISSGTVTNHYDGFVEHKGKEVVRVEGQCGGTPSFSRTDHALSDAELLQVAVAGDEEALEYADAEGARDTESILVWKDVRDAIVVDDMSAAGAAKSVVEERMRAERRERKAAHSTHEPSCFVFVPKSGKAADFHDGDTVEKDVSTTKIRSLETGEWKAR